MYDFVGLSFTELGSIRIDLSINSGINKIEAASYSVYE